MRPEKCGLSGNILGWVSRLQVASKVMRYVALAAGLGGAVVVMVTAVAVMGESVSLHLNNKMNAGIRRTHGLIEIIQTQVSEDCGVETSFFAGRLRIAWHDDKYCIAFQLAIVSRAIGELGRSVSSTSVSLPGELRLPS